MSKVHSRKVQGGYVSAQQYPNDGEPDWRMLVEEALSDAPDEAIDPQSAALRRDIASNEYSTGRVDGYTDGYAAGMKAKKPRGKR